MKITTIGRDRKTVPAALLTALLMSLPGCERRNPYEISRERRPDLYAGDRPVSGAQPPRTPDRAVTSADESRKGFGRILPGAREAPSRVSVPGDLEKVDLAAARLSGAVSIEVNDPVFPPRLDALFDGDTRTLSRTESVNPLVLTLRFQAPVRLGAVRIYPSYSSYDWGVTTLPGTGGVLVRDVPENVWSAIGLDEPIDTALVTLAIRRLERDDFVHVNEVEIWIDPAR